LGLGLAASEPVALEGSQLIDRERSMGRSAAALLSRPIGRMTRKH
jgi:hypothetical protein